MRAMEAYSYIAPLIKEVQRILDYLNLPYSCSLILSILLLLRTSASFRDLVLMTGYAKSTVSACVNMLDRISLLDKVKRGRRYEYRVKVDVPRLLLLKQESILVNEIESLRSKVESLIGDMRGNSDFIQQLSELNSKLKVLAVRLRQLIKSFEEGPSA